MNLWDDIGVAVGKQNEIFKLKNIIDYCRLELRSCLGKFFLFKTMIDGSF